MRRVHRLWALGAATVFAGLCAAGCGGGEGTPDGSVPTDTIVTPDVRPDIVQPDVPRDTVQPDQGGPDGDAVVGPDSDVVIPPLKGGTCDEPIDSATAGTRNGNVITVNGDTTNGEANWIGNCTDPIPEGQEQVVSYTATASTRLVVSTDNDGTGATDTVVYVRRTCTDETPGNELACNDDIDFQGGNARSTAAVNVASGDTIFVIVDTYPTFDDEGNITATSGPYQLTITELPLLAADAPCDPAEQKNFCDRADNLICRGTAGAETCQPGRAPVVTTVTSAINEDGDIDLTINGTDEDGDVTTLLVTFFDRAGNPIDLDGDGQGDVDFELAADPALAGQTTFTTTLPGAPFIGGRALKSIQVKVGDSAELVSNAVSVIVQPGVGEACDATGAANLCVGDGELTCATTCNAAAGSTAACAAPVALALPGDSGALVINEAILGTFEASCVFGHGRSDGAVFSVTVPAGTTNSDLVASTDNATTATTDTAVSIRTTCLDPASEVACDDDGGDAQGLASVASVNNVTAGTYFILVDSGAAPSTPPAMLPYRLTVALRPVVASGGTCDPDGIENRCADGLECGDAGTCAAP